MTRLIIKIVSASLLACMLTVPAVALADAPPVLSVTKSANPSSVLSGGTVTYTITITNSGAGAAVITSVEDLLPASFTYVAGTTTGFTTTDPVVSGQTLTWAETWPLQRRTGNNDGQITFSFQVVATGPAGDHYNNATVYGNNFTQISSGDTAPVTILPSPQIVLTKTVDKAAALPGEELTYTVHYHNIGGSAAYNLVIIDSVPPNTTYVPGSLRAGGADSTYDTATPKTDAVDADEAEVSGGSIIFRFSPVDPNDGAPDSGPDEGKVYLKLLIDS